MSYAVGNRSSDGARFALVPLADLIIINDMLGLVDDVMVDEVEVRQQVADTIANEGSKQ